MPHNNNSFNKLRELELRRHIRQGGDPETHRNYQRRYPSNTMGPQEYVLERRRGMHRKHVTIHGAPPKQRHILFKDLTLLGILILSIWGLYALTIYLLTHF
jgi:hypothetical protein